jgi:translocation and assembly module TamB
LELVQFSGDLNPVPVNLKLSATYSPGNLYLGRCLLTRGPLSLSAVSYFGPEGLIVEDLQVFNGRTRLLQGDTFLPLSYAAVLQRRPWRDVILPEQELMAAVRTDNLELGAVAKLFGQQSPIRGRMDWTLNARGKWTDAEVESRLSVSGLQAEFSSFAVPLSRMAISTKVVQRKAEVNATFTPEGGEPIEASAALSVMGEAADGRWTLFDRQASWEVSLAIPATDLTLFRLRNGRVRMDAGQVSGKIHVGNTPSEPVWSGKLELLGGRCHLPEGWRSLEDIRARVSLAGSVAKFEETVARAGGGQWTMEGSVDVNDWRNLHYDLAIEGDRMELFRNENLDLRGNVELRLTGDNDKGSVRGDCNLAGSRLLRELVVSPLPSPREKSVSKRVAPFRALLSPFTGWDLDVRLHAPEALPSSLKEGQGSWQPSLRLSGTMGEPLLEGAISLTNFPVNFPAAVLRVARGAVIFTTEQAWMPQLDLVASGEVGGYEVRAAAAGLLGEEKLTLTSSPALPAEQLLALLQKGSVSWVSTPVPGLVESQMAPGILAPDNPSWLSWDRILGLVRGRTSPEENPLSASDGGWPGQGGVVGYEWFFR